MSKLGKSVKQEDTFYFAYLNDTALSSSAAYPDPQPYDTPSTPQAMYDSVQLLERSSLLPRVQLYPKINVLWIKGNY